MPLTACFYLCSRDLAWVGIFTRSAMSSALYTPVKVSVGYCLLLAFLCLT